MKKILLFGIIGVILAFGAIFVSANLGLLNEAPMEQTKEIVLDTADDVAPICGGARAADNGGVCPYGNEPRTGCDGSCPYAQENDYAGHGGCQGRNIETGTCGCGRH